MSQLRCPKPLEISRKHKVQLNPPLTVYMYVSFGKFKRIIGEFIKINRILFWEIQNSIIGNVLGIIGSGLSSTCSIMHHAH